MFGSAGSIMSIARGLSGMMVQITRTNSVKPIGRCLDTSRHSTSISATQITFRCSLLCLVSNRFYRPCCAAQPPFRDGWWTVRRPANGPWFHEARNDCFARRELLVCCNIRKAHSVSRRLSHLIGQTKNWNMPKLTIRIATLLAALSLLMISAPSASADSPAEMISKFRLGHGEVRVTSDSTLNRIAAEQARAMAAKDNLSHEALGSFTSRIAPSRAGRAAENIAYGYDNFEKTLGQWINSSEHRKNLLLRNATRLGIP